MLGSLLVLIGFIVLVYGILGLIGLGGGGIGAILVGILLIGIGYIVQGRRLL